MGAAERLKSVLRDTKRNSRIEKSFREYIGGIAEKTDRENRRYQLPDALEKEYVSYYRSFGFRYVPTDQIRLLYSVTGNFDRRIVPDILFNLYIDPIYPEIRDFWQNKSFQSLLVPEAKFPNTLIRNVNGYYLNRDNEILTKEEALRLVKPYKRVVIKPTVFTGGGVNVRFYDGAEINEEILGLYGKNFLIQEKLRQSRFMSQFNAHAVCTDKICSFLHQGKVYILSSFLRIAGGDSENDNLSFGSRSSFVGINEDGSLKPFGYDLQMSRVYQTGQGVPFSDIRIPFHGKCLELIRRAHLRLLDFPFVSWDFAQGEDGEPVLIEYNLKWHSLYAYELFDGPIFGALTDEILREAAEKAAQSRSLLYK